MLHRLAASCALFAACAACTRAPRDARVSPDTAAARPPPHGAAPAPPPGRELWRLREPVRLVDADADHVLVEHGHELRVLDAATGRPLASIPLPPQRPPDDSHLVAPGIVTAFADDDHLSAFAAATGKLLWRSPIEAGYPPGCAARAIDGRVVCGIRVYTLEALDLATGAPADLPVGAAERYQGDRPDATVLVVADRRFVETTSEVAAFAREW
ncbi:MAG: PQQ-binding-like beta-propeller repeat protein [Deltaproteobacteria bacterium]|nr:PQQ-binding-like beta-propeller repeat protein [Deltaproteobacteria bacterium]